MPIIKTRIIKDSDKFISNFEYHKTLSDILSENIQKVKEMGPPENIEKHNYTSSPEEDFIEKESYDELKEKINQLKPNYKEVLKYRYFDDLSIKEISKKLKQPISTIKIKIFRAKKLLIEKIKSND